MDLWKASAGLHHYLLIAKRKADNFDKRSLNLVNVWLLKFSKTKNKNWLFIYGQMFLGIFPRDILQGFYFLIFLSMIFSYLLKKHDICNFADHNTLLFTGGDKLSLILEAQSLIWKWFNLSSLKTNLGNFQFIILKKSLRPKYCLRRCLYEKNRPM